ncbi:MAG: hypothetical protein IT428_03395 [Planctomycetaceae bacterium]|nr:hypothetical protein [Planctomycetaceae bacterium]
MELPKDIVVSLKSLSWAPIRQYLSGEDARERVTAVIDTLLREGYLAVRHRDPQFKSTRDNFLTSLNQFVQEVSFAELRDRLTTGMRNAHAAEVLYETVLAQVDETIVNEVPAAVAWACIRLAHLELLKWVAATRSYLATTNDLDPLSFRVNPGDGLPDRTPDHVSYAVDVILAHQLRLLAFQNRWIRSGILEIPEPVSTLAPEHTAHRLRELAAIWHQVECSESKCRLFGGDIEQTIITLPLPTGAKTIPFFRFDFPIEWEWANHVAGERLRRQISSLPQVEPAMQKPDRPGATPLTALEARDWVVIHELTGTPVLQHSEKIAGLQMWEWLRGYTVLRAIATEHIHHPSQANEPCIFAESALVEALQAHGLDRKAATRFIAEVCLPTGNADLHDCPLLRLADGHLCLMMFAAMFQSAGRLVLSQCGRRGHHFPTKGAALEAEIRGLFVQSGIPTVGVKRRVDGEHLEIDCLALWDGVLFVVECKNYALPSESVRNQFSFFRNQREASAQLLRIVSQVESHPEIVRDSFPHAVAWERVVPLVINGFPFCFPGEVDGVYCSDRLSLRRFFGSGRIYLHQPGRTQLADVPSAGHDVELWSGEPDVEDFLKFLDENPLFYLTAAEFKPSIFPFPVSPDLAMATIIFGRGEAMFDEMLKTIPAHLPSQSHEPQFTERSDEGRRKRP